MKYQFKLMCLINPLLTILTIISLILAFHYSKNSDELLLNLSCNIIASSIFYFVVVYLNDRKKENSTLSIINKNFTNVTTEIRESIMKFGNFSANNIDELKEKDFALIAITDIMDNDQFFKDTRESVILKVKEILALPTIIYLDMELIENLYKLRDCRFYDVINRLNKNSKLNTGTGLDIPKITYEYYKIYSALSIFIKLK